MGNARPERPAEPAVDLFDRWLEHHEQEQRGEHATPDGSLRLEAHDSAPAAAGPTEPAVGAVDVLSGTQRSGPAPEPLPSVVEFVPRTRIRRLVGLLLLASAAVTALAAYDAYLDPTTVGIGIAATLGALTAVLWAARAGSAVAVLTVRGGMLEIVRGGSRHRFDLAGDYTQLEMHGEPGSRGWKVLFHRRSMAPYVVDSSMVDPVAFTRVLREYRPGA